MYELLDYTMQWGPYRCPKTGSAILKSNAKHMMWMQLFWSFTLISAAYIGNRVRNYNLKYSNGDVIHGSWRTPIMFGNNQRNPLFSFKPEPFYLDFEEYIKFYADRNKLIVETIMMYYTIFDHSHLHP